MPTEGLVVPRGARRWRVATYEVEELVRSLRARGVRYGAARAMVPQALAHRVLVRMELAGDSPDDRVQNAVARSKPVKDYADLAVAGGRPGPPGVAAAVGRVVPRRVRRGRAVGGGAGAAAVDQAAQEPGVDAVDAGRGDPGRRGRRPDRAHRVGGPHRGRRGAGPLTDDAARVGPPILDGIADRARRPRPGHDAVGDALLGRGAGPPRQAGRARRAAHPRVPGPGRGDRVRRPAAARDRPRPRAADVRAPLPRRARDRRRSTRSSPWSPGPSPRGLDRADRPGRDAGPPGVPR